MLIPSLIHVMWRACISARHDPGPSALLSFNHGSSLLIRIHRNAVVLVRTQGFSVMETQKKDREGLGFPLKTG